MFRQIITEYYNIKMKPFIKTLLIVSLINIACTSFSQDSTKQKVKTLEQGKFYFMPLPVLGYNPVMGFLYGAAGSGNFLAGSKEDTRLSALFTTVTYSTNKQLHISLKSNVYTNKDQWMLIGDWRYFLSSQPTYGLGTGPQSNILLNERGQNLYLGDYQDGVESKELMLYDLIRLYETALYQLKRGIYLGLGYHYDRYSNIIDQITNLDTIPPIISKHYAYSKIHNYNPEKYTISGPSLNFMFDTRDNINNPYTGSYALLQLRYNPTWLGSDSFSTTLWLEYRKYFRVSKKVERNLIAIWSFFNLTVAGQLPYMGLPSLGWDQMGRSGRAYPQGRFRGEQLFYFESEYRFRIPLFSKNPDFVGGVIFANVTSASATDLNVKLFDYLKPGLGLGLRFMFQQATRTNVTFDYGIGADLKGAFFFNLKEYF